MEHEMEDRKSGLQRRRFLLTLGAGGVTAAAAVVATAGKGTPPAVVGVQAASEARAPGVSEHARAYYRSARI
jgi:hypothetical protein